MSIGSVVRRSQKGTIVRPNEGSKSLRVDLFRPAYLRIGGPYLWCRVLIAIRLAISAPRCNRTLPRVRGVCPHAPRIYRGEAWHVRTHAMHTMQGQSPPVAWMLTALFWLDREIHVRYYIDAFFDFATLGLDYYFFTGLM
jgi:hypothetical protein